jgi:hypothetical protein
MDEAEQTAGDESESAGDSMIFRRDLETIGREQATVVAVAKVVAPDVLPHEHPAVPQLPSELAGQAARAAQAEGDPSVPVPAHDESWLSSFASSIWSWLGIGDAHKLASGATQTAELPLVALAGMFTFATLGRRGVADARPLAPPTTDERFETIQRRWWRERRRGENGSRIGRGPQRRSGSDVASAAPADNGPNLAQPNISEAFVMSLMDSVEPDAFVMSPLLPARPEGEDSSENAANLSPSMKLAFAGAAIGGTAVASNALATRRGSTATRPARPVVRYTGTTVVPQSSHPQAARS